MFDHWSRKIARATEQLSQWATTIEPGSYNYWAHMPKLLKPACPRTRAPNRRSYHNETPMCNWRVAPTHCKSLHSTKDSAEQKKKKKIFFFNGTSQDFSEPLWWGNISYSSQWRGSLNSLFLKILVLFILGLTPNYSIWLPWLPLIPGRGTKVFVKPFTLIFI